MHFTKDQIDAADSLGDIIDLSANKPNGYRVLTDFNSDTYMDFTFENIMNYISILRVRYEKITNEKSKEIEELFDRAKYKDGYIEFEIEHNSKYVLVSEEIEEKEATVEEPEKEAKKEKENEEKEVTFLESNKMYIIIIAAAVVVIIVVIIIIIVNKKKKAKKQEDGEEIDDEENDDEENNEDDEDNEDNDDEENDEE